MLKLQGRSISLKWIIALFGVLVGLVLLGYYLFPNEPDIPPQNIINQALSNTAKAKSYEYTIKMVTFVDGKEQINSNVKGKRQSQSRIHIKGRMFDSELDFYQLDTTTYTKDQLTGEWIKITDNRLNQQEIFMGELNPLANFTYKELSDAKFIGLEKIDGQKLWVYTVNPVIDNRYMEILWKDFQYKFWISPRGLLIRKGEVIAVSKNNPSDKLDLLVEFENYNGNIEIEPPN